MSAKHQNMVNLTCDNCGAVLNSAEAGVCTTDSLRRIAAEQGWIYVRTMVPRPEHIMSVYGSGPAAVRRHWDFCPACGLPEEMRTTVNAYQRGGWREVPVRIVNGLAVYGCPIKDES